MTQLCNYKTKDLEVHVYAEIKDGRLFISGHDLGPNVETFWGSDEYEYFYNLTSTDTDRLYHLLKADSKSDAELLELIKLYFSDLDGCENFRKYCKKHNILFSFDNYFSI